MALALQTAPGADQVMNLTKPAKVLVVDDERSITFTLGEFLKNSGYEVLSAHSAEIAIDTLQNTQVELVITDIMMPGKSGIDLLNWVNENNPRTKVIVLTGQPSIDSAVASLHGSAADYLLKPVMKQTLMKAVDKALTESEDPSSKPPQESALQKEIRSALEKREFVFHYQPRVELGTRTVSSVECLIRWNKPGQKLIYPGDFIDEAEKCDLILDIGDWCIRTAAYEHAISLEMYGYGIGMAINLSAKQFRDTQLPQRIQAIIDESKMDPRLLELEVTESVVLSDLAATKKIMDQLNEMGVKLSVDDFGTGYSSLSYLKHFPLHTVKIDKSFVQNITTDKKDATITKSIIDMSHSLGLNVIAEGVETQEQLSALYEFGCDSVQGYYLARPMKKDALLQFIREMNSFELEQMEGLSVAPPKKHE